VCSAVHSSQVRKRVIGEIAYMYRAITMIVDGLIDREGQRILPASSALIIDDWEVGALRW
jgi:hypothetical protein